MTDKGPLTLSEGEDLSLLKASADGYSSLRRDGVTLYPLINSGGALFFSKRPNGDSKSPVTPTLVDFQPSR